MVEPSRKEYRKPYILTKGGYQEMMRATSDKSVWNDILDVDPAWAEFLFTRSELPDAATAAEIRYLRYLKQSEFKAFYLDGLDYEEMEYLWPGIIPMISWEDFDWDFPWRPRESGGVYTGDPDDDPLIDAVCDANSDGCYCPGSCVDITFTANFPIAGIQFIFNQGETQSGGTGVGSNSYTVTICAPEGRTGQMRIRVIGTDGCDSTVNIYQCDECCPDECTFAWDWDNSTETINPPGSANVKVKDGVGPYTWQISSEDGLWNLDATETEGESNVVNAEAGACGSATITVTDSCDCVAVGSVRNPASGVWTLIVNNQPEACAIPGNNAITLQTATEIRFFPTQGKYQQDERHIRYGSQVSSSFTSNEECVADMDSYLGGCADDCDTGGTGCQVNCGCVECSTMPDTNGSAACASGVPSDPITYVKKSNVSYRYENCCNRVPPLDQYWDGIAECWCISRLWLYEWLCP